MVDSEYIVDTYEYVKTSIGTVIRNPEIIKFVPDHLKIEKMCKRAVKKLPSLLRYVPDRYKTQEVRDKAILVNGGN